MSADKTKTNSLKKKRQKSREKVVHSQDINTAILRDVRDELTND